MRRSIRHFVLLVLVPAAALADDLTVTSRVTGDEKPARTSVSYVSRDRVRMPQGDGKETIVDFRAGTMTTIDGGNRTYYVTTRQDLDRLAARLKERMDSPEMKQARERMKDLPPEQRKSAEALMGGLFGAVEVRKTGSVRTIAGYRCENWTITMGELSRTEECLSEALPFPKEAWEMYREFAESLKSLMASFGPLANGMGRMQEKFKDMKGYPLASTTTISIMGRTTTTTTEVTGIRRGPIPASAWEIPAGYRKVDNPMLKALRSPK